MRHTTTQIRALAALAGVVAFATAALATEPRITASSRAEASHELTPAERRATSLAAGRVLRHAYLARQAVAEKDAATASAEVKQGVKLVEIIESVQPKYTVTAEIKAGKLTYSADELVAPPLVPIYEEVGEVELAGPLAAARKEQRSAAADVVDDVSFEHTAVYLNLAFAKAGLQQAGKALDDDDLEAADRGLALVQRSVTFEVDAQDLPLSTARENLYLAKSRVAAGDGEGAREALEATSEALDDYAELAGDERSREVEQLRSEIQTLSADIAAGKSDSSASGEVEGKILSWWERVVEWWEE